MSASPPVRHDSRSPQRIERAQTTADMPATIVARRVSTDMGSIHFGGSGRPVPSVLNATGRASATRSATGARMPHVVLESNPTSPFTRKMESERAISLSPRNAGDNPAHSRRTRVDSARSSPARDRYRQSSSTRDRGVSAHTSRHFYERGPTSTGNTHTHNCQHSIVQATEISFQTSIPANQGVSPPKTSQREHELDSAQQISLTRLATSAQDDGPGQQGSPSYPASRASATLPKAHALAVDKEERHRSMPRTEIGATQNACFHTVEGHHRCASDSAKRYHIAVRSHRSPSGSAQTRTHPATISPPERAAPEARPPPVAGHASFTTNMLDGATESTNQISEDPPIGVVERLLLHNKADDSDVAARKRLRQRQRQRLQTAAVELREDMDHRRAEHVKAQERKVQVHRLSETIRRQNQRHAERSGKQPIQQSEDNDAARDRRAAQVQPPVAAGGIQRKPPVPRLSGSRGKSSKRKRSRSQRSREQEPASGSDDGIQSGGGTAAAILLGNSQPDDDNADRDGKAEVSDEMPVPESTPPEPQPRKRRLNTRTKHARKRDDQEHERNLRRQKADDERRELGREYMLMKQRRRMIEKAKAKEQSILERDRRRKQLEVLEMERLKGLKHSLKRKLTHEHESIDQQPPSVAGQPPTKLLIDEHYEGSPVNEHHEVLSDEDREDIYDAENDAARGNAVTMSTNSVDQSKVDPLPHFQTTLNVSHTAFQSGQNIVEKVRHAENDRLNKLLELRSKAQTLSARLIRLRNLDNLPPADQAVDRERTARTLEVREPVSSNDENEWSNDVDFESQPQIGSNVDGNDGISDDDDVDGRSEELASSVKSNEDDSVLSQVGDDIESRDENELSVVSTNAQSRELTNEVDVEQERLAVPEASAQDLRFSAGSMRSDEMDFDVHSIGVQSIAVVWPLSHDERVEYEAEDAFQDGHDSRSSVVSSSLSASSSPDAGSPPRRNVQSDSLSKYDPKMSAGSSDHENEDEIAESPKILGVGIHDRVALVNEYTQGTRQLKGWRADATGLASAAWKHNLTSGPSEAFLSLVRAEDDSLSVIQRVALKMFQEQERKQLKHVSDRDQQSTNEEHSPNRDLLLSPGTAVVADEDNSAESDQDDALTSQYATLDEIMQEVDRERGKEREETDAMAKEDDDEVGDDEPLRNSPSAMEPAVEVTASTEFWNYMIADRDHEPARDATPRPSIHVEIDHSELDEQREQRLRDEEHDNEDMSDDGKSDMRRRMRHSPHTLAKRLLAEVEYQEAISEAHLKLAMMEQAQLLEHAQMETINMATAFKEEMEESAAKHQLALDHAALEKQFDGDLNEVVQQLHSIEETAANERAVEAQAVETQLKQARMRESSVQTDELHVVDAATFAPLQMDAETSPSLPSGITGVQYEFSERVPAADSHEAESVQPSIVVNGESGNDIADYAVDTFDEESQFQSHIDAKLGGGSMPHEELPELVESESLNKQGDPSDVESVYESDARSTSEVADSVAESQSGSVHSSVQLEEEEEEVDDNVIGKASNAGSVSHQEESAAMEYEDDFNASSPLASKHRGADGMEEVEDVYDEHSEERDATSSQAPEDEEDIPELSGAAKSDDGEVAENDDEFAQSFQSDGGSNEAQSASDDAGVHDVIASEPSATRAVEVPVAVPKRSKVPNSALSSHSAVTSRNINFAASILSQEILGSPAFGSDVDAQSDQVIQSYMVELERRKTSEESMLNIRFQAAEAQFAQQMRKIESALAAADSAGASELTAHKQRLAIAFMGEKANIESLKAAATARYYQDMLVFQSLVDGGWSKAALGGQPESQSIGMRAFATVNAASLQAPPSMSIDQGNERSDDDFASVPESDAHAVQRASSTVEQRSDAYSEAEFENETQEGSARDQQKSEGSIMSDLEDASQAASIQEEETPSVESDFEHVEGDEHEMSVHEEPKSDAYGESDFEDDTRENSDRVEEHPDAYPDSDFEDETTGEGVKEDSTGGIEIDEESDQQQEVEEDGGVPSHASGEDVADELDADMVQDSAIEEDGRELPDSNKDLVDSGDIKSAESDAAADYYDDFASADESTSNPKVKSEHEEVEDFEAKSDSIAESSAQSISSNEPDAVESAADAMVSSAASAHEPASDGYSEDEFESSGHQKHSVLAPAPSLPPVEVSAFHSTSEDSSTTKLLFAEVSALQKANEENDKRDEEREIGKLEKKKAKVVELVEAKERLLQQQTRTYRLDEEKRLVNEAAHAALGIDISQELREAKERIASELQNEFDELRQKFPKLKKTESSAAAKQQEPMTMRDMISPAPQISANLVDAAVSESPKSSDGEYDAQSFEAVSEGGSDIGEEDEQQPKTSEHEKDDNSSGENSISSEVADGVVDEEASEVGEEDNAEIADSAVEDEMHYESDNPIGDGAEAYDVVESDDYEQDYENESFADAQSVASVVGDDGEYADSTGQHDAPVETPVNNLAVEAESDAASEYTSEDFEQVSETGTEAFERDDGYTDQTESEMKHPTVLEPDVGDVAAVSSYLASAVHVDSTELSAALDTVKAQIDESEVEPVESRIPEVENSTVPLVTGNHEEDNDANVVSSVQVEALGGQELAQSTSSSDENALTKSIEERTARLEQLKTLISERKKDIRQVQRQMRIEKQKKNLTTEEREMWDEMEGLQTQLQLDVASLELLRQRNRLEFHQLEARQQHHQRFSTVTVAEHDLLLGFDYTETAEQVVQSHIPAQCDADVQTYPPLEFMQQVDGERGMESTETSGLLAGYDYIERVEDVVPGAMLGGNDGDEMTPQAANIQDNSSETHDDGAFATASLGDDIADLLEDYEHVEVAEQPCEVSYRDDDLLLDFDYVEDVEECVDTGSEPTIVEMGVSTNVVAIEASPRYGDGVTFASERLDVSGVVHLTAGEQDEASEIRSDHDSCDDFESVGTDTLLPPDESNEADLGGVVNADDDRVSRSESLLEEAHAVEIVDEHISSPVAPPSYETMDKIATLILADLLRDANDYGVEALRDVRSKREEAANDRGVSTPVVTGISLPSHSSLVDDHEVDVDLDNGAIDDSYGPSDDENESKHPAPSSNTDEGEIGALAKTNQLGMRTQTEAEQIEWMSVEILSVMCEAIVLSQVRACRKAPSRVHLQPQAKHVHQETAAAPPTLAAPTEAVEPVRIVSETDLQISQLLDVARIQQDKIDLPPYSDLRRSRGDQVLSPILYDSVLEIGQTALDAHRASGTGASLSDEATLLAVKETIRRDVEVLHTVRDGIRENANRLVKKLVQDDDQMDAEDMTLLQNFSRPTSLSGLVEAAQSWIARPPAALGSTSAVTPRTPTSSSRGGRRTSMLSLTRHRQAAELQQRITARIFDDLLGEILQPLE